MLKEEAVSSEEPLAPDLGAEKGGFQVELVSGPFSGVCRQRPHSLRGGGSGL